MTLVDGEQCLALNALADEAGCYLWEPDCLKSVTARQPPLFQPFEWAQGKRGALAALMRM